jgi:hypothetical protein
VGIEQAALLAEPAVDLLERHEIGVDLADHVDDPVGPKGAVGPSAFVDVIGCDLHEHLAGRFIYRA